MARQISTLIVHCSATPVAQDIGAAEIDAIHRQKGWARIGYHYVIRRNGAVEKGRPDSMIGAHAVGFNNNSIGICLIGGVDKQGRGQANYTAAQMATLGRLLASLLNRYPGAAIMGHRDTGAKKDCPSFNITRWLETGELSEPRLAA